MKKNFYVLRQLRTYNGDIYYRPCVEKRFATKEEAEQFAAKWNKLASREANEKMYRSWVEDEETKFATEEWYEKQKNKAFYSTYVVKESK